MLIEKRWKIIFLAVIILIGIVLVLTTLPSIHTRFGRADYLGYWSAAFLLSQGENFSDDVLILQTQDEITNSNRGFPIKSWNPPWLLAWLLPFTFVGFDNAATLWLVSNFLLIFVSIVFVWKVYAPASISSRWFWLPILAAFIFPFTATALVVGQVNSLVLFGLASFLYLYQKSNDFGAGVALSLTMTKPQLVYLTIPLILMSSIRHRRWKIILGFSSFLLVSIFIVFLIRPTFLGEYIGSISSWGLLNFLSPTAPVVLSVFFNFIWIRLIGFLLLPIAIWIWFRRGKNLDMGLLVDVSLLASIITTPFLWSYDYIVLLIPLIRVWIWMIDRVLSLAGTIALAIVMMALYIFLYNKRIQTPSEIFYTWVPVLIAAIYGWLWYRKNRIYEI